MLDLWDGKLPRSCRVSPLMHCVHTHECFMFQAGRYISQRESARFYPPREPPGGRSLTETALKVGRKLGSCGRREGGDFSTALCTHAVHAVQWVISAAGQHLMRGVKLRPHRVAEEVRKNEQNFKMRRESEKLNIYNKFYLQLWT